MKSSSGKCPHLVMAKNKGQYCCDSDCGNHKSLGICSHSVAVAEIDGELKGFVDWFVKAKKQPNITNLIMTGMPTGRGRKGGVPPRKRKKSVAATSRTTASCFLTSTSENTIASTSIIASMSITTTSTGTIAIGGTSTSTSGSANTTTAIGGSSSVSMTTSGLAVPRQICVPAYPPPLVHCSPSSTNQTVLSNCAL